MKKTLLISFVMIVFISSCGSSGGSDSGGSQTNNSICQYGTYKCDGNLYYCGYSGDDLEWLLLEKCDNGCDDSTGKCKEVSSNNNSDNDSNDNSNDDSNDNSNKDEDDPKPETRTAACTGLPENAEWNTVSEITQTKNGSSWSPSVNGSYNTEASTTECRFKCVDGYAWNGSECFDPCKSNPCSYVESGTGVCIVTETGYKCDCVEGFIWNGNECIDPCVPNPCNKENTTGTCNIDENSEEFYSCDCKEHYTWSSSTSECVADTQQADCSTKPANSVWNDNGANGKFTQEWNGEMWDPASYASTYSIISGVCRYKCQDAYHWEENQCLSNIRTASCTDLPANAEWNTATSITQEWDGSAWQPSTTGTYNVTPSTSQCRFKCKTKYSWSTSASKCVADTQQADCSPKPANSVWNDNGANGKFTQDWNGSAYNPASYQSSYNTNPGTCRYKCDSTHYWYDSECTNPCDYEPCEDMESSTGVCNASSWQDYSCGCNNGYSWSGTKCEKKAFGNICTGQTTCYDASSSITCPAYQTDNFFGQDAQYALFGYCIPQNFTINSTIGSEKIVVDNNTGLEWQQTISTSTYAWAAAKNYCDNLNYGGYDDWRLPTPKEFTSIVDLSRYFPAVNSTYFPNTPTGNFVNDAYNSASMSVPVCSGANCHNVLKTAYSLGFTVFDNGVTKYQTCGYVNKQDVACPNNFYVRCVRGNTLRGGAFVSSTISGNIVITDSTTGLMWQKDYVSDKNWQSALSYCEKSTYAGYSDWRLPNKNELASLINLSGNSATSDFPDMPTTSSYYFWSSSSDSINNNSAWRVACNSFVFANTENKTNTHNVRCVR